MLATVRHHLQSLIAFPSISVDSNRDIAHYCSDILQQAGFVCHQIPHPSQDKINILAVAGDITHPGILFSAHTDVVPVDGQDWTYPPFELTDMGDKWYGRGTTDMKGYIALLLAFAEQLVQVAKTSHMPVSITLTYEEEVGCQGAPFLIEQLPHLIPNKPLFCFVGEPTQMKPILGHKGKIAAEVSVRGLACHSSVCTQGINAIEIASGIITYIRELMDDCIDNGHQDPLSIPPHATLQTGVIQGGSALNIVPDFCTFQFEIRSSSQKEISRLYDAINRYVNTQKATYKTDITVREISSYPPLSTGADSAIKHLAESLCGHPNTPPTKVSFGTEGGLFAQYGIETIVLGPGNMEQGHKPDEFITVSQIQQGINFFNAVLSWIATNEHINTQSHTQGETQ